jgi:preprotein translocase subunit SecE
MNTKASNVKTGTSAGDLIKYVLAALVAAAGVVVFYFLPAWPAPIRGLLAVLGFVGAVGIVAMTAVGHQGREFFSESLFELRKVVWPTQQEAMRITGVVLLVVTIISLILAGFDFLISIAIKWLLGT